VYAGPFEKLARGYHLLKSFLVNKEILAAIDFPLPWRTSRVRDRIAKIFHGHNLQHVPDDCAFAAA
jgi:hypothetical protein